MHLGRNNVKAVYEIDGTKLDEVDEERDLGVIMQKDLRCNQQCSRAVKTANRVLGMIKRTFTYLNKENMFRVPIAWHWSVVISQGLPRQYRDNRNKSTARPLGVNWHSRRASDAVNHETYCNTTNTHV